MGLVQRKISSQQDGHTRRYPESQIGSKADTLTSRLVHRKTFLQTNRFTKRNPQTKKVSDGPRRRYGLLGLNNRINYVGRWAQKKIFSWF